MIDMQELVTRWSARTGGDDTRPWSEWLDFREDLMYEELVEFIDALRECDMAKAAKELGDLLYAVIGSAVRPGIDGNAAFLIVHESNMSKVGPGMRVREDGKILKPPDYTEPDMAEAITDVRMELVG
jgi:predicted HAD superfamily Cof-like phosphohydrolase